MCKCKQAREFDVDVNIDKESMQEGYDGDLEPGTDTSDWVAYQLVSYARCTRCGAREDRDAMGSCWVTGGEGTEAALRSIIDSYAMVPKGALYDLLLSY